MTKKEIELLQAERDKYKEYYEKCHDCPIVCGKESWLKLLEENIELEADRDQWKARAEALENAIRESYSSCQSCKFLGVKDKCFSCYADNTKGNNWEFDDTRLIKS